MVQTRNIWLALLRSGTIKPMTQDPPETRRDLCGSAKLGMVEVDLMVMEVRGCDPHFGARLLA